ncbi:multicopper oxidase family protein [Actinophytocola algeriensis]|uniref:Multicopper oxidase CueO n=1 Tax=Actinophytocola algeriensis TaxID=1768010 RepID=A0A7W7Q9H1_9PSEU|nr:multicopper oxidase domain-containing protein [Actinophytocola algeriensis]MBB4909353.1 FtsP/CotA-like multicopper oxidase with cupredoxin domain [Actinophytocola algeriensis]MBE1475343.1 FtsP/CotA-like multicopper oxidase with cupredoxin domain [Actinophytocola algeriensis]
MLNRRRLLSLGAAAAGGSMLLPVAGSTANAHRDQFRHTEPHTVADTVDGLSPAFTPFAKRMPVAPVASPVGYADGADVYRLAVKQTTAEILPGLQTEVLTFGGNFLAPTIRARTGRPVRLIVANQHDQHANVHMHGAHVAASSDGHPMDLIMPGQSRTYEYTNKQQGTTLWYHDHSHGTEASHVYHGLHGVYVIEDDDEQYLRLPSGAFDVPIMLRDGLFDANGQLVFGGNPAERDVMIANGQPVPYFPVAARKYRFRLVNAATERVFKLDLGGAEMLQIGTDGGLLPSPVPLTELELSSAERADIVIDFSRFAPGTQLVLSDAVRGPVLRFDVQRAFPDFSRVPDRLRALPALRRASVQRDVVLSFDMSGPIPLGLINGLPYDPQRSDVMVQRGTTEIWRVFNGDGPLNALHNFHLHLEQFRVLGREGSPTLQQDAGLKDTVQLPAGTAVLVQTTFREHLGKYAFHCHFLEHSSLGMMAQMEIVP